MDPTPKKTIFDHNGLWKPGAAPYAEWLKTRTPEQLAEHKRERAARKSFRKANDQINIINQAAVLTALKIAESKLMQKAIAGDVNAYIALYDRIVGRPAEVIETNKGQILPWTSSTDDTK